LLLAKELEIDNTEVFLEEIIPFDINLFDDYVAQWKHGDHIFKKKSNPFISSNFEGIKA
jgi:predicted metal-dependent RNase